ncbi:CotH kinase family protein [Streptomyces albidoflavus]
MTGTTLTGTRKRRLRDRLPVRLRQHWKPVGALAVGLAMMVALLGDVRISPYVTSASRVEADTITDNVTGTVGLYDTSASHSIHLTYQQTDFEKMMKEFEEDGTKDYIKADLVVDGVYLDDVGIRLKGNSTLRSLRGDQGQQGERRAGRATRRPVRPVGPPARRVKRTRAGKAVAGAAGWCSTTSRPRSRRSCPGWSRSTSTSRAVPTRGSGRSRSGRGQRPGAPQRGAVAVAHRHERAAGRAVRLHQRRGERPARRDPADGREPRHRLRRRGGRRQRRAVQGRAGSSFAYQGDDPSEYESSFKQLNKKGSQDLEPVMKLVKWVENASDEDFARDLDQHVDVESLAAYVATQNLLLNFDDMAGPGKNYLLRYDLDTKKFSVLGWDYNLTFSGDATAGPEDPTGMGGGMAEGMPEGFPEGADMPQGGPGRADGEGRERGGPGGGAAEHPLKTRFLETDAFDEVYLTAYQKLYQEFYASRTAAEEVAAIAGQARAAGAGSEELDTAVSQLAGTVTDRAAALAKDEQVAG